jgi:hypothetical protein
MRTNPNVLSLIANLMLLVEEKSFHDDTDDVEALLLPAKALFDGKELALV